MDERQRTRSARIRARLDHPVVDVDGHLIEYPPTYVEFLHRVAGPSAVRRFERTLREHIGPYWFALDDAGRRDIGAPRGPWWGRATRNTLDRATSMLPDLLRHRLDDFGIDFTVVYPTLGLMLMREEDADSRRACCRALNEMLAELFRAHGSRMTPAATIPMGDPAEAIAELTHARRELGMKAAMIAGFARRSVPAAERLGPQSARFAPRYDNLCLDSDHDYDPFWQACIDLGVAPTAHSAQMGWGSRISPSNYVYNHVGMFAAAHEAFAKALVLGGVTRRFPALNVGFLEGGVGWAVSLLADLIGHWEKRGATGIAHYDPAALDVDALVALIERWRGNAIRDDADVLHEALSAQKALGSRDTANVQWPDEKDDFRRAAVHSVGDLLARFVPNFYFGCEADDRLVAAAFDGRLVPGDAPLQAMFSSDISHWDVVDMETVLEEAFELVEDGALSVAQFRAFSFEHAVRLHGGMNPGFFDGTVVASEARAVLGRREAQPPEARTAPASNHLFSGENR
jgi:predicted TIM-barrel fold metal-dependent hydrolase